MKLIEILSVLQELQQEAYAKGIMSTVDVNFFGGVPELWFKLVYHGNVDETKTYQSLDTEFKNRISEKKAVEKLDSIRKFISNIN